MNSRQEIKEFVLKLEQDFPTDEWEIDGVHIWPHIRIRLFNALWANIEKNHNDARIKEAPAVIMKDQGFIGAKIDRIRNSNRFLRFEAKRVLRKLPGTKFLVATSSTHRTLHQSESYNKFADPLLDQLENGINLETSAKHLYDSEIHRSDRVFYFYDYFNAVLKSDKRKLRMERSKHFEMDRYADFLAEVYNKTGAEAKEIGISEQELNRIMDRFHDFEETYELVLDRVKPEIIFSVCFYTFSMMALNYVANKRGIKTVEIQHGPQTDTHMGYAAWNKVPATGFNTMPEYFWNWDKYSNRVLNEWIEKQRYHKCFIGGNLWMQYVSSIDSDRDVILYSLQNLKFEYLFPEYIIDSIRQSRYEWWLRLHPRQLEYLNDIKAFFNAKNVLDKINIEDATNEPLPSVLDKTKVHITNFSGCALEAAALGIPSIIIDERGRDAFHELIEEGIAIFCEDGLHFNDELDKLSTMSIEMKTQEKYDLKEIIGKLK